MKSISWPTAEIIGIFDSYIAIATSSSLNGHKSSIDPPPLPTIKVSILKFSAFLIWSTIVLWASSPCTRAGNKIISQIGHLLLIVEIISFIAAPVGAVTTPTLFGILGISFFLDLSNRPFFS